MKQKATISVAELRALKPAKRSKYGNKLTTVGARTFHSKKEAARYVLLRERERCGEITDLQCQPVYTIGKNGVHICKVILDFSYFQRATNTARGEFVLEDVKSEATQKNPVYRLKKRLLEAFYPGIKIVEVTG